MEKFRIIPKLEIKSNNVVKGIRMEGLRVVGLPSSLTKKYIKEGADEILLIDTVASLYDRNQIHHVIKDVAIHCKIPLIVGGGLRTHSDIETIFRIGADKISINTAAHRNIQIIKDASQSFGSQAVVASVQAKKRGKNDWKAFFLNGREVSNWGVVDWCKYVVDNGAGEILLTSIDYDGTMKGLDKELVEMVLGNIKIPVIVSGGVKEQDDLIWLAKAGASGAAVARCLHFGNFTIKDAKLFLAANSIPTSIRN